MNVKEICPRVVLCSHDIFGRTEKGKVFRNEAEVDLAFHFMRYQEFYECDSDRFAGKSFQLIDFIVWYTNKKRRSIFSYASDWAGYNIPSDVIFEVHALGIQDPNRYDAEMIRIANTVGRGAYIIGANDPDVINHETAHGLFYTTSAYRDIMEALVSELSEADQNKMFHALRGMGYAEKVLVDETQAYMATGTNDDMIQDQEILKPFQEVFKIFKDKESLP